MRLSDKRIIIFRQRGSMIIAPIGRDCLEVEKEVFESIVNALDRKWMRVYLITRIYVRGSVVWVIVCRG